MGHIFRRYALRRLALGLAAALLPGGCKGSPATAPSPSPSTTASPTAGLSAQAVVSDSGPAIAMRTTGDPATGAGAFDLVLPPHSFDENVFRLGTAQVTVSSTALASLTAQEQATVNAQTSNGKTLLNLIQLDVAQAPSKPATAGFHILHPTSPTLFNKLTTQTTGRCPPGPVSVLQVELGTFYARTSNLFIDASKPYQVISGTIDPLDYVTPHWVLVVTCPQALGPAS